MTRITLCSLLLLPLWIAIAVKAAEPQFRDVPPSDNPKRIVYLCDASKSMKARFADFASDLTRAIQALKPQQSFTIILLGDGKALPLSKELIAASDKNKAQAADFLKKAAPAGATTAVPGMQLAFAAKPDHIYFATDGGFTDPARLIDATRQLNEKKRVIIDSIGLFELSDACEKTLKQLADENAGVFKLVTKEELAH